MAFILITLWVLAQIEARAAPVAPTVFVGDSIVHMGPWSKLCRGAVVIAKPSGTTRDILDRVPDILAAKPATVVLMIGVNDIALAVPADETIRNVEAIIGQPWVPTKMGFVKVKRH